MTRCEAQSNYPGKCRTTFWSSRQHADAFLASRAPRSSSKKRRFWVASCPKTPCSIRHERVAGRNAARQAQRFMGRWTAAHTEAANRCIEPVRGQATITFWDPAAPSWVTSNASDTGFCAYLSQARPDGSLGVVAILSRRFTPNRRLWSVGARELYGLLEFMRKHGHLVAFAESVTYCTDHLNLLCMLDLENSYVRRWCAELMQFLSFQQLIHSTGRCNALAHHPSRWCSAESDYAAAPAFEETPWLRARRSGSAMHRTSAASPTTPTPTVQVRALQTGVGGGGGAPAGGAPAPAPRARRQVTSTDIEVVDATFSKILTPPVCSPRAESTSHTGGAVGPNGGRNIGIKRRTRR